MDGAICSFFFGEEAIKTNIFKEVQKDMKNLVKIRDKKRFVVQNLPYLFFFYLGNIFSAHTGSYVGGDVMDRIFKAVFEIHKIRLIPSIHSTDVLIGIATAFLVKFIVHSKIKNAKKFRQGVEYGSARWGDPKDIEPYLDEKFENNILLTNTESLTMNSRPKNPKFARNKNVLVVGGSGSGKTRFFLKPNLMQMHSSYVVTDPKGLTS